jgi:16S rRNA processing protein RimM
MTERRPPEDLFVVGKVLGAWGRAGLVRVLPLTDFPERLPDKGTVRLWRADQGVKYFHIREGRLHQGHVLLGFKEAPDMTAAEALKGCLLMVEEGGLEPLPEGSFYHHQIIGLAVEDEAGRRVGTVREIVPTGATDVWIIREGTREVLIPAVGEVVRKVDLAARKITVSLPPEEEIEKK